MSIDAPCASHPGLPARDACARCGSFACNECLSSGERSASLCTRCDAQLAAVHSPRVASAARGTTGSLFVIMGLLVVASVCRAVGGDSAQLAMEISPVRQIASWLMMAGAAWCAQRIVRDVTAALARPHASRAESPAPISWSTNFA
jgi:hypothetical protein